MNLIGKKITLRAIEKEDCEFLKKIINDPDTESNVVGWSFPISTKNQEEWYEKQKYNLENQRFIIEYEGDAIGLATLTDIDWKNRKATHGLKLYGKNIKGRGFGTDTVQTIMKYAFEELQLNKLCASILQTNIPSQKMFEKCGWKIEGISRESVFKNNKYIDEIIIGILKEEYEKLK